jgi:hypothetical protein
MVVASVGENSIDVIGAGGENGPRRTNCSGARASAQLQGLKILPFGCAPVRAVMSNSSFDTPRRAGVFVV